AKELTHILSVTKPALIVTAAGFGRTDYLTAYADLMGGQDCPWLVVGDGDGALPAGATRFDEWLTGEPLAAPVPVDPNEPAVIAFTSGTTRDPKGVIHSHRTMGFEARQLSSLSP